MSSTSWLFIGLLTGLVVGLAIGVLVGWFLWHTREVQLKERLAAQEELQKTLHALTAGENGAIQQTVLLGVRNTMDPMLNGLYEAFRKVLSEYQDKLQAFEQTRSELHGELKAQITQVLQVSQGLARETSNLTTALRSPQTRGRWGEQQLRRLVELAGMMEHCDFDEQVSMPTDKGGAQRPDLVVHLPESRNVIVDSKVPLDAYLASLEATSDEERQRQLERHASQVKSHVDDLARRSYPSHLPDSVDFVVAFIPGDPLLSAAWEKDPTLFEYALSKNVLLATPTTLIALLKAVAFGWQQDAMAQNAKVVAQEAQSLYKRLVTLGEHLENLGKSISSTVSNYNKLVGSMESRVLPQARKFKDLGAIASAEAPIPDATRVEETTRSITSPELLHQLPRGSGPSGDIDDETKPGPE
jgi:DNA recombination protein RmuC